ncbi:unnamed protein product [Lactuca saligna]|uniref:Uncharacterized protein n=1 Tax=Lactuca saligna TaxID=75948 RepID=A0AA35ZU26_LACSI|nr:unnamed protein product [Lactuca saligna]
MSLSGRSLFGFSLTGQVVAFGEPLVLPPPSMQLVVRKLWVVPLSSGLLVVLFGKPQVKPLSSGLTVEVPQKPPIEPLSSGLTMVVSGKPTVMQLSSDLLKTIGETLV